MPSVDIRIRLYRQWIWLQNTASATKDWQRRRALFKKGMPQCNIISRLELLQTLRAGGARHPVLKKEDAWKTPNNLSVNQGWTRISRESNRETRIRNKRQKRGTRGRVYWLHWSTVGLDCTCRIEFYNDRFCAQKKCAGIETEVKSVDWVWILDRRGISRVSLTVSNEESIACPAAQVLGLIILRFIKGYNKNTKKSQISLVRKSIG